MENIKIEDKIDFIYKRLKLEETREKRKLYLKIFFFCSIFLIIIFSYFYIINQINSIKKSLSAENLKENIIEKTWDLKENFSEKSKNLLEKAWENSQKLYDYTSEKINNFKNNNTNY